MRLGQFSGHPIPQVLQTWREWCSLVSNRYSSFRNKYPHGLRIPLINIFPLQHQRCLKSQDRVIGGCFIYVSCISLRRPLEHITRRRRRDIPSEYGVLATMDNKYLDHAANRDITYVYGVSPHFRPENSSLTLYRGCSDCLCLRHDPIDPPRGISLHTIKDGVLWIRDR